MKTALTQLPLAAAVVLSSIILQPSTAFASPAVTSIAGGLNHSLFSKSDGSLWAMGDNEYGQLGLGAVPVGPVTTNIPQQVPNASGVSKVAAGANHSLFKVGRQLWAMGYNAYGQLGDGTTNNQVFPEKIFAGSSFISATVMAGGFYHSLFGTSSSINASSTGLWAMGANGEGELGDGTDTVHYTPEQVESTIAISAVAAGYGHSLYLKADGSLWGMGDNTYGQLGLGSTVVTRIQVMILSNGVTAVAAGWYHSLFIKSDGSLWAMGKNDSGQLGDTTTTDRHSPKQITLNGVTAVAAGGSHSLFIKSDGSLWGMGLDEGGQLGLGCSLGLVGHHLASQIVASNVVTVAAGGIHSLFIKSDGSLWGMGTYLYTRGDYRLGCTPVQVVAGPPPPPLITGISLSGANLNLTGANGVSGEILYTLMSTDVTLPLSQWQRVATNTLAADGNFTITAANAVDPNAAQRFYILQAQ